MNLYTDKQLKEFAQRINDYIASDEYQDRMKTAFNRLNLVIRESSEVLNRLKNE